RRDCLMAHYRKFLLSTFAAVVAIVPAVGPENRSEEAYIQVKTGFADVKDDSSLHLYRFSRTGHIPVLIHI
ncbi:hypothetical protein, partial [Salmonella enterica]|uniref:hypothetical protein n=1 Tax=Salmonella enterica TaxID=28901 RepID=UPI001F28B276